MTLCSAYRAVKRRERYAVTLVFLAWHEDSRSGVRRNIAQRATYTGAASCMGAPPAAARYARMAFSTSSLALRPS